MSEEFYKGQIFIDEYPTEAAAWCNDSNGKYTIDEIEPQDGHRRFQIKEDIPVPPTRDEIKQRRKEYRETHIDDETAERSRCMANGTWTAEDEQAYLALDAEVTAWIEENLPYPD